jgi:hypothetical protein
LISERLEVPVADFVTEWRGYGASWRRIALAIEQRTGIEVSHTGLRKWFIEPQPADEPSGAGR